MVNIITKNENKYHNLRPRSQRKDEDVSKIRNFDVHDHSIYHDETSGCNLYNQTICSN